MTRIEIAFRLRIHDPDTATPSDGTVDFTLDDLADVPQFGGQIVEPTGGRSILGQWSFSVVDADGIITSNISDPTTGRADLIGRLAEIQENRNSGGWATVSVGRLTGLSVLEDSQAKYTVEISDERWVERNTRLFTEADTAYLWPSGMRYPWRGLLTLPSGSDPVKVLQTSGNRVRLEASSLDPLSSDVAAWIRRDVVAEPVPDRADGEGNFQHLRCLIGSTEYPVISLGDLDGSNLFASLDEPFPAGSTLKFWVWAPGGVSPASCRLWAPTAPPSATLPLHLGTTAFIGDPHRFGYKRPFRLLEELYELAGVRYDSDAIAALQADTSYPDMGWRITDPNLDLAQFVEEQIYAPLGVVPFVDDSGRVSPRSIRLPAAADFDPSTAFVLDESNCRTAPTFSHQADEVVNVVTVEGRRYRRMGVDGRDRARLTSFPADYVEEFEVNVGPTEYESVTQGVGPRPKTFKAHGLLAADENPVGGLLPEFVRSIEEQTAWLTAETFDRFGDGPVWGSLTALRTPEDGSGRTAEDLQPGDLFILDIPTFPNMATRLRGGARVVQAMSIRPGPQGIAIEFLDAGPNLQPLLTPTISVALSGSNPRHAVALTIGSIPSGARVQVRVGIGSGSEFQRTFDDLSSGSVVSGLPSGTLIRVQVRAAAPGRVRSLWSSTASVTTNALPAPTSLAATVVGRAVKLSWTPAASGYPLMPVFRTAGGGAWTNALEAPLPPGSGVFTFAPQAASTSYDWGVRHVDQFGGLGTVAHVTEATSTARQLGSPLRPQVLQGRAEGGLEDLPPEKLWVGVGIHVGFLPAEPSASTVAEVSTDSGFSSVDLEVTVAPGARSIFILTGALDETVRYVRLIHRRDGNTDSDPSPVVSSKPTALLDTPGNDAFPGGFAEVFEKDGGELEIFLQSGGDVNTDGASYAWSKNPAPEEYPEVDDDSRSVGPLPFWENLNDDGDPPEDEIFTVGDVVMIRVRFRNTEIGFGQEFLIRHVYGDDPALARGPAVTWRQAIPDPPNTEDHQAVEFVVTDSSDEVALWYQEYAEGGSPAEWDAELHRHTDDDGTPDDTGYASDPLVIKVEVDRPAEGGTARILRYRGENGEGVFSDEQVLRVDGDREPSGKFLVPNLAVDDTAAFVPDSDDPDAGSWRVRIKEVARGEDDDFDSVTWSDGANEVAGSIMDALTPLTGKTLSSTNQFNIEGYFLGTPSTVGATQQASARSKVVRAIIRATPQQVALDRVELYNPTSGPFPLAVLRIRAFVRVPGATASVRSVLTVTPWDGAAYDPQVVRTADVNVSPTAGLLELVCPTTGGGPNTFKLKDQIDSWDIDLYDAPGGASGSGNLIASFRLLVDVLAHAVGAGQVQLYKTDGEGDRVSADALRLGDDGRGDGVFLAADGAVLKLRDSASAGTVGTTWAPDYRDGACQFASLGADTTLLVPTNWGTGRPMNLRIALNGHALTFQGSRFYAAEGSLPTLEGVVFLSIVQVATNYVVIAALSDLGAVS